MSETSAISPDSPNTTSANDRVKASLENWKRKLLDLTKRNRALNFKVNKVSTITIVDEQPAEVFRQLYLHGHLMRFKAAPDPDVEEPKKSEAHEFISSQPLLITRNESVGDEVSPLGFEEEDEDEGLHS